MIRRRDVSPELERLDRARSAVAQHVTVGSVGIAFADIEHSVTAALSDRDRLRSALGQLDPVGATRALKAALRVRPGPDGPDTPEIAALRRRHDAVHRLRNQVERLERRIEATLVDAEALAATAMLSSARSGDLDAALAPELHSIRTDLELLDAAHRELEGL